MGCEANMNWWENTVVYHVYLPTFKDGNNDGIGDFKGLTSKLDYFDYLKVKTLMISPFYPSPMKDNGYDVSNYVDIHPMFGTMENFDVFMAKAKKRDLSIIIDLVFNHTSDQHEWFKRSVRGEEPYKDYYVWVDPKISEDGSISPPNNWISVFGGSAWQWSKERKQYYLHQFLWEQPDLNLRNKNVREELKEIIKFWLEKGLDGFRVDAVSHLFEDELLRDEPESGSSYAEPDEYDYHSHIYTQGQPENLNILKEWRQVLNEYCKKTGKYKLLLTENVESIKKIQPYFGTVEEGISDIPFYFKMAHLRETSTARQVYDTITSWLKAIPERKSSNWILGDHDFHRMASRVGPEMVNGIHMIALLLPGVLFCYYGDELGMEDLSIEKDKMRDSFALRTKAENSRDPARSPMQWSSDVNAGFTEFEEPWLPVNKNYKNVNVEKLKEDPFSILEIYRRLLNIRREAVISTGTIEYPFVDGNIFSFIRLLKTEEPLMGILVIVNFGSCCCFVDLTNTSDCLPEEGQVELTNVKCLLNKSEEKSQKYFKLFQFLKYDKEEISLNNVVLLPKQGMVIRFVPKFKQE